MNDKKLLILSALLGIPGFALIGFGGYHGRISIVGLILFLSPWVLVSTGLVTTIETIEIDSTYYK